MLMFLIGKTCPEFSGSQGFVSDPGLWCVLPIKTGYLISHTQITMCMELPGLRTWIVFYLISFVVLLWAAFLSAQGVMLWVSLFLVIIIVGLNFYTVYQQIKLHASHEEFQRKLTEGFDRKSEGEKDDRSSH